MKKLLLLMMLMAFSVSVLADGVTAGGENADGSEACAAILNGAGGDPTPGSGTPEGNGSDSGEQG